jgi:hypothetical protein
METIVLAGVRLNQRPPTLDWRGSSLGGDLLPLWCSVIKKVR